MLHDIETPGQLRRHTLTEQIVEWLAGKIINGEMPPETPLPEAQLAKELGCSRSPLREALWILSQHGLVDINPGKVATVTSLDPGAVSDFFDTRALLESHVTRLATEAMTEENIKELQAKFAELEEVAELGDLSRYREVNWQFHDLLYSYCPNAMLIDLVRTIWRRRLRYGQLLRSDPGRLPESVKSKYTLMKHIVEGEGEAAGRTVCKIVMSAKTAVLSALEEKALRVSE